MRRLVIALILLIMTVGSQAQQRFGGTTSIVDLLIDGQTSGDVLYFDGTNWTRLAIGSESDVLTVASSLPSWAAAAGGSGDSSFVIVTIDTVRVFNDNHIVINDSLQILNTTGLGLLDLQSTNAGGAGPTIETYLNSASPAATDIVAEWSAYGENSAGGKVEYTAIKHRSTIVTSTQESGKVTMEVRQSGSGMQEYVTADGDAVRPRVEINGSGGNVDFLLIATSDTSIIVDGSTMAAEFRGNVTMPAASPSVFDTVAVPVFGYLDTTGVNGNSMALAKTSGRRRSYWTFDNTAADSLMFSFMIPSWADSLMGFEVIGEVQATGNIVWDVTYEFVADDAAVEEGFTYDSGIADVVHTGETAAGDLSSHKFLSEAGERDLTASKMIDGLLIRDHANGSDTMAGNFDLYDFYIYLSRSK